MMPVHQARHSTCCRECRREEDSPHAVRAQVHAVRAQVHTVRAQVRAREGRGRNDVLLEAQAAMMGCFHDGSKEQGSVEVA